MTDVGTILAVDVAATSGWCIRTGGEYHSSGQCDAFGPEPLEVCRRALGLDRKSRLVLEQPSHGNRATLVGLGAARGAWLSAWQAATGLSSSTRVKSVYPATWRSQLFSTSCGFQLQERLHAQVVSKKRSLGPDEAAAVCIASWAETELRAARVLRAART
jgi:hypothetical protein